jgi:hypothetical protein
MLAFCSNKKLVTRATTPVLSRPITVMVAKWSMVEGINVFSYLEQISAAAPLL